VSKESLWPSKVSIRPWSYKATNSGIDRECREIDITTDDVVDMTTCHAPTDVTSNVSHVLKNRMNQVLATSHDRVINCSPITSLSGSDLCAPGRSLSFSLGAPLSLSLPSLSAHNIRHKTKFYPWHSDSVH